MFVSKRLLAGAVGLCLFSATGITLVAAHAEVLEASPAIPAAPAAATVAQTPEPQSAPEAAPAAAPAARPTPAAPVTAPAPARRAAASGTVDAELTCLAKIVLHEAGNQSRQGQLAVAQVVMNRVRSPRFPNSICAVALQPGQFFNVHRYNPPRDARWRRALEVARDARAGISPPVVGNALFFRAAYANSAFFRSRTRVAAIGDHVFYR